MRYLYRIEDTGECEYDGIADCWYNDRRLTRKQYGLVEIVKVERLGVDTAESEILLLEGRLMMRACTKVKCFGKEEDVEEELDCVSLGSVNSRIMKGIID